jgi:hypothetical protein
MSVYPHLALHLARRKGGSLYRIIRAAPGACGALVQYAAPASSTGLSALPPSTPSRRGANPTRHGAKPKREWRQTQIHANFFQ